MIIDYLLKLPIIFDPIEDMTISMTPWPSWLRRKTVNLEIVSSILTGVAFLFLFARFQFRSSLTRNSSSFFSFFTLFFFKSIVVLSVLPRLQIWRDRSG